MLNPESQTMREFSISTKTKKGEPAKVLFGYDTSANHSGYYISLSVNNERPSSDAKAIKRIRALGIDVLSRIADFVGCDVTGIPYDLDARVHTMLATGGSYNDVQGLYRISVTDDDNLDALEAMINRYDSAKNEKEMTAVIARFSKTQRLRMIEENRSLVQSIREFYLKGIDIDGQHIVPCFEGLLRLKHNPTYYKRDMDYIRKARVRLFKHVLKRNYKPF